MTANDDLPTDHNSHPEQFLRNDAVRDALPLDALALIADLKTRLGMDQGRICVRYDCAMLHTAGELTCENCGSATVPEDAEQLGNCLMCHCGIFEIDDAPKCHNGCSDILGKTRSCRTCIAAIPLNFDFCPACGSSMEGAQFFDGDPVEGNRGPC